MINLKITRFDWDDGNQGKCKKHALNQKQFENFFHLKNLFVAPDPNHSQEEERFLAVGQLRNERPRFVVFTIRRMKDETPIRPISARYMHKRELKKYEEESSKLKER